MSDPTNRDGLAAEVRSLLDRVLGQSDFPGRDELVQQTPTVSVVGGPVTMLELRVSQSTPASVFADGPIPVSAEVFDASDVSVGELLVWVDSGRISALEFAWWTDDPPRRLPSPSRVKVARK